MSIQLIFLHVIIFSSILIFVLLAYFEYGLGPIKLRPKVIKHRQNTNKQKIIIENYNYLSKRYYKYHRNGL